MTDRVLLSCLIPLIYPFIGTEPWGWVSCWERPIVFSITLFIVIIIIEFINIIINYMYYFNIILTFWPLKHLNCIYFDFFKNSRVLNILWNLSISQATLWRKNLKVPKAPQTPSYLVSKYRKWGCFFSFLFKGSRAYKTQRLKLCSILSCFRAKLDTTRQFYNKQTALFIWVISHLHNSLKFSGGFLTLSRGL